MFYQKRIQRFRLTFIPALLVGVVCTNLSTVQSASSNPSTSTSSYQSTTKVITSAQPTSITQMPSTQKTSTPSQVSTTTQSNSILTSATTSTVATAAAISTTSSTEKSSTSTATATITAAATSTAPSTEKSSTSTATATITAAATSTAKATASTAAATTSTAATTATEIDQQETITKHGVATASVTLTSFLETFTLVPTTTMKVSSTSAVTTTECDVLTSRPTSSLHQSTELPLGPESQNPFGSISVSGQSPFQTDGSRELSLTCLVTNVTNSVHFFWNVTCVRKTDDTCVLKPHPPENDGKVVTCTVCNDGGQSATVAFTLQLLYPPLSPPVIHGYQTGDVLQVGNSLTMTCSVSGGKPVVTSVLFFCPGNPDGADDRNQSVVSSSVTITSLKSSDNGSTCTCTATWEDRTLYRLSETRILVVNGTEPSQVLSFTYYLIIGVAAGVAVVIILVIIITIVCIRKKANHTYDRPTPNNDNKDEPYSYPNPVFHTNSRERVEPDSHVYNDIEDTNPYSFCTKIQETSADHDDLSSV